jgi:hypothetical protein
MNGDLKPYQDRERVEEAAPGGVAALGDGDFRVQLISHGATRDNQRYYRQRALEAAAGASLYDGAKMYVNHRDPTTDTRRGHRDVRDWAATIKPGSVRFSGGVLEGVAHVHDPVMRGLLEDEVAKGEIGVSQDATVKYYPREIDGKPMHVVESIDRVHSVDFVPTGNAWGRVVEAYEEAADSEDAEEARSDMTLDDLSLDVLEVERPDLVEALTARVRETLETEAAEDAADVIDDAAEGEDETITDEEDETMSTDEQTVEDAPSADAEVEEEAAEQEEIDQEAAEATQEATEDANEAEAAEGSEDALEALQERVTALETENTELRESAARAEMTEAVREAVAGATGLTAASKSRVVEALTAGPILEGEALTARVDEACETERKHEAELAKALGANTRVRGAGLSALVAETAPDEDAKAKSERAREAFIAQARADGLPEEMIEVMAKAR